MISRLYLLTCVFVVLIVAACGDSNNGSANSADPPVDTAGKIALESNASTRVRNQVTDSMLAQIIEYYRAEYGGGSISMTLERSDTVLELSFKDTAQAIEDRWSLFRAYMSLVKDIDPILSGDMNGDGMDDMLVSVRTEGGGGGGNVYWSDHFLFVTAPNGTNRLADVKVDGDIMDGSGYFSPTEISNQTIKGTGNGYADGDGHCCPSLYYNIQVRLVGGELKTVSKVAVEKPVGF